MEQLVTPIVAKPLARYFECYAREDQALVSDLSRRVELQAAPSRHFQYERWRDTKILVGEDWGAEIDEALEECTAGLLYVSPAFLGSRFILQRELPRLLGTPGKVVFPVMLKPISFQRHETHGLEALQVYRLNEHSGRCRPQAYSEITPRKRDAFAAELYGQIDERLLRLKRR